MRWHCVSPKRDASNAASHSTVGNGTVAFTCKLSRKLLQCILCIGFVVGALNGFGKRALAGDEVLQPVIEVAELVLQEDDFGKPIVDAAGKAMDPRGPLFTKRPKLGRGGRLGADCVAHARNSFNRTDFDLGSAVPASFALAPQEGMVDQLRIDYHAMTGMNFDDPPEFEDVLATVVALERRLNATAARKS